MSDIHGAKHYLQASAITVTYRVWDDQDGTLVNGQFLAEVEFTEFGAYIRRINDQSGKYEPHSVRAPLTPLDLRQLADAIETMEAKIERASLLDRTPYMDEDDQEAKVLE